jgi:hypothetical protein
LFELHLRVPSRMVAHMLDRDEREDDGWRPVDQLGDL